MLISVKMTGAELQRKGPGPEMIRAASGVRAGGRKIWKSGPENRARIGRAAQLHEPKASVAWSAAARTHVDPSRARASQDILRSRLEKIRSS
jgi:hypothetical protein